MKKVKANDRSFASPRVVNQLWEMIDKENIAHQQKSSIFLEMTEYRRKSEELARRNDDLVEENACLVAALQMHKESSSSRSEASGAPEFDVASRISSLHREIRRLDSMICEMEKMLARREIGKDERDSSLPGDVVERRCDIGSSPSVTDDVYKQVVEECGELRARMATLESKHAEELCDRDRRIVKLGGDLREMTLRARDIEEKLYALRAEDERNKERLYGLARKGAAAGREVDECMQKLESMSEQVEKAVSRGLLEKRRVEQLIAEKDELEHLVENYRGCERRRAPKGSWEEGSLEEEIVNLIESVDKGLEENRALVKKLESVHERNRELESEAATLRMANADLSLQNARLEVDVKCLKTEPRGDVYSDSGDDRAKAKRLEASLLEANKAIGDYKKRLYGLSAEKEEVEKILERVKGQNREAREEISRLVKASSLAEAESRRLSGLLKTIQSGDSDEGADLAAQLERYRTLLRCTLCDTRFKDTTISKCMHCFCEECVASRIRMRDRKCPSCNEPFAPGDVKKIYL